MTDARMPANLVVVLLDSLNRHMIGAYGGAEFETPNLDRFADRAIRFEQHVAGSLPCMPARHDILCGALDFLWKPWGSIEVWEEPITMPLRREGVTTALFSDHPHLFEVGGENYHCDFRVWEYLRGHEADPWKSRPDPSWVGAPALPAGSRNDFYDTSRSWFKEEADFPGPKVMQAAADWLRTSHDAHDRFLLFVDEFDPHEPFDTPEPWAGKYDPDWDDDLIIWPTYAIGGVEAGMLSAAQGRQIRANYGSKLSMIDHWFGRLLDTIEECGLWDDTAVVVCTDHGHFFGEKDIWGKPLCPQFEPMVHTPLLVWWPGADESVDSVDALTTNVDLYATIADVFGAGSDHRTHGSSIVPLVTGDSTNVREWALSGIWGNWVQITDGRNKYARAAVDDGFPISMWSNRWSTMPLKWIYDLQFPRPDKRATLDTMPGTDVPVIRQPFEPGDYLPYWLGGHANVGDHHLYDLEVDPDENENRVGERDERRMLEMLRSALDEIEAPDDQYARLGL